MGQHEDGIIVARRHQRRTGDRGLAYRFTHARLLAGPGTGKTHTIAARVAYLVNEKGINPVEILVLTFTRLATRQLRSDIGKRLGPGTEAMPYISTLHAFALRQLRHNAKSVYSLMQPLRIADDWEERKLIQEEMKGLLETV